MKEIKITILYDNYTTAEGTQSDWGFCCLIEGLEKKILFDTGTKPEILIGNAAKLGVDLSESEILFLSHNHIDHVGSVKQVVEFNPKISVYVPASFPADFEQKNNIADLNRVSSSLQICTGAYSSGELGIQIKEHSLVIDTDNGLVVIVGCSHPGIVTMLKTIKEIFKKDIYLFLGGLHLLDYSDSSMEKAISEIHELDVNKCGASHCTGDRQISMLKSAFDSNYVSLGTGRQLIFNSEGIALKP